MKKTLLLISGLIFFSFVVSAQMNVSVSLNDEIYEFLDVANKKGLCSPLNSYKPYTRSQILQSLRDKSVGSAITWFRCHNQTMAHGAYDG